MSTLPPPISDQPVLKLSNVESAYGPIKAIRGVSLQVRRGEIATVLGSNGAGKTTILKTISGIIDPRKGSVEFKGQDITARDPAHIVQEGLSHVPEGREVRDEACGAGDAEAARIAVDYANSYWADSHVIFGSRIGYDAPGGRWQAWAEMRNLGNRHYAATVTPGYDDKGLDAARSTPGEGMAAYVGVSWSLL